jgi:hypothetical protein
VAQGRRLRLRGASILGLIAHMGGHASRPSVVKFLSESLDLGIIFIFHLDLGLFQLVQLGSEHLHFLDLTAHLILVVLRASALAIEFLSHLIQKLGQTIGRKTPVLRPVHSDGESGSEWREREAERQCRLVESLKDCI